MPIFEKLFAYTDDTVEVIKLFGSLLNVKISSISLKNAIEEHPDYPSLLSIGDILDNYGIKNITGKFESEKMESISTPFITQMKDGEYNRMFFTVVKEINSSETKYFDLKKRSWITIRTAEFIPRCTGIALLGEARENAGEREYKKNYNIEKRVLVLRYITIYCIPILVIIAGLTNFLQFGIASLLSFIFSFLALVGSVITVLLLWYELDQYNPFLQQICSAGRKTNCGAILQSKGSQIFGVSWSVIGFTYFVGSLTYLLLSGIANPSTLWILSWLNLFATCYIFYSLYYQWKIAKRWCVLCLGVQAVLFLQYIVTYISGWRDLMSMNNLSLGLVFQTVTAFVVPFITVTLLLPALANSRKGHQDKMRLQRLKHDAKIFEILIERQKSVTESTEGLGIILGNPLATHKLIKVCNPYCGPCSISHSVIDDLLDNNSEIQLQIIFTATTQENDRLAQPVKHLLAIADKKNEDTTRQALDDWYLAKKKSYQAFAEKYPMNGELKQQDEKIQAMSEWCNKMRIRVTPTFFLDGRQLPEDYSIMDLKYFLSI